MTDADGGGAVVRMTSDVCYLVYVCFCVQCIIRNLKVVKSLPAGGRGYRPRPMGAPKLQDWTSSRPVVKAKTYKATVMTLLSRSRFAGLFDGLENEGLDTDQQDTEGENSEDQAICVQK